MTSEFIIGLATQAVYTLLKASLPLMLAALVTGLIVSILQATTQIQEQTLAFVPKIIAVFLALLFFGQWILQTLVDFAGQLIGNLHTFIG